MPSCVVSVINYKGGVGKTTITANLGAELAARGRRVLLVDLDPQASLTFSFFRSDEWETTLAERHTVRQWFDAFIATGTAPPLHPFVVAPPAVNEAAAGNGGELHLVCSHLGLIEVDLDLAAMLGGARYLSAHPRFLPVHRVLAGALAGPPFDRYDVVLIDCPPNFNMVTRTAIVASDHLLIPARPDYLSTLGIDYLRNRLSRLVGQYGEVAPEPVAPEILGVVATMIQFSGTGILRSQQQNLELLAQIEMPVFRSMIRDNKNAFADAGPRGVPVVLATERSSAMENLRYELQQLASEFMATTRV
jgi:chromosome partitioning protein